MGLISETFGAKLLAASAPPVVSDPALNPFTWLNATLGTTLNGPRLSRSISEAVEALRISLAGAGFRLADEKVTAARLVPGSTTQAFRLALGDVCEAGGDDTPLFQVGVRMLSEVIPDDSCPSFAVRPMAVNLDGDEFLEGLRKLTGEDTQAWADRFCSDLTAALTP